MFLAMEMDWRKEMADIVCNLHNLRKAPEILRRLTEKT